MVSSLSRNAHGTLYVKNGILLKYPFFKTKFKDIFFKQTPQHNHFCALNSLLNVVGISRLGYLKIRKILQKSPFSRKLKITKFEL